MLVHARGASAGVGSPHINLNNHPFTSSCKSVGLIHNGRIPDSEYDVLVKKYEVMSSCDSEILLRIFEAGADTDPSSTKSDQRLAGIKDIWSFIDKGHMAVAIGERPDEKSRSLFMFRNKWRSLWLADTRKELGQVFFCSTPEIWNDAFKTSGVHKLLKNKIKLIELPPQELWVLNIGPLEPIVTNIKKYDITSNGRTMWKHDGKIIPIVKTAHVVDVITKLDEYDQLCSVVDNQPDPPHTESLVSYVEGQLEEDWNDTQLDAPDLYDFKKSCSDLRTLIDDLQTVIQNQMMESTYTTDELRELMTSMEQTGLDLEGMIKIWSR